MDIKTYLETSGETQSGLAAKCKCSQGAVWQWVVGRTKPSPLMAARLEKATKGAIKKRDLCPEVFGR